MSIFDITPRFGRWRLTPQGEPDGLEFSTFVEAEHRARWLAMRQEVRGRATEIRILDETGVVMGTWRGERYQIVSSHVLEHVA